MIIQCTACQSRFKLADDKLKPEGVKVRCTKCQHIFTVMPPVPENEPPQTPVVADDFSTEGADDFSGFDAGQGGDFDFGSETAEDDSSTFSTGGNETDFSFDSSGESGDFSLDSDHSGDFSFEDETGSSPDLAFEPGGSATADNDFSFGEEESSVGPEDFSFDTDENENSGDFSLDSDNPFAVDEDEPSWGADGSGPVDDFDFGAEGEDSFDFESDLPENFDAPPPAAPATPAAPADLAVEPSAAPAGKARKPRPVPPPSISRRKSPMTGLTVFLLVLLLLLAGTAGYFFWSGKTLNIEQLIHSIIGQKSPVVEIEQIKLTDVTSFFVTNTKEGQLFVIRGKAVNGYPETRSAIAVKGILYSKDGKVLKQQTAYCGNPLDDATLKKLPFSKVEESMNNQFGDSLSNLNVGPGKAIPFTIVFKDLPANLAEFATEVSASLPGSKQ